MATGIIPYFIINWNIMIMAPNEDNYSDHKFRVYVGLSAFKFTCNRPLNQYTLEFGPVQRTYQVTSQSNYNDSL